MKLAISLTTRQLMRALRGLATDLADDLETGVRREPPARRRIVRDEEAGDERSDP
jgi:hypothetical protein